MTIKDLLKRNLSRKIEEVIQLNQAEEETVHEEITEYVATGSIRRQYRDLLEAINHSRTEPTSGVGVWISGFFGSGKSSFAKNLGYVLANRSVKGERASELFKERLEDPDVSDLIDVINTSMPAEVVMFDVQKDKSQAGHGALSISPFVYRVLLRELDYAEDFDVAEIEITLEQEGRLDDFIRLFDDRYAEGKPNLGWMRTGRKGALKWERIGMTLHTLDPETYPRPESFTESLVQNRVDVTPNLVVQRSFDLMERRRPGKALIFLIDEVGQYVAYSQERLEDLRALVELFGAEGSKRLRANRVPAQAWFIVTAQERLEDVVSAIGDDKKILIAKVQDRFPHRVDLSQADVREVASRRVLSKTPEGQERLRGIFTQNEGKINDACRLDSRSRGTEMRSKEFADFYPYLPHYVDLSIDIMAGIRLQPGAMKHMGGSNRTIISQVYEMLVNPRTDFASKPVGSLVSLDTIYDLIEGQVGTSTRNDIAEITTSFSSAPEDNVWPSRVAKVIALLEFVRDLPRTRENIAALLVDGVEEAAPVTEVGDALERLVAAQFIRDTGEGYKLQTAHEKSWEAEKQRYRDLRPRDRDEISREIVSEVFDQTNLKRYVYKGGLKTFAISVGLDGSVIQGGGQIPLSISLAENGDERAGKLGEAVKLSRERREEVFWVFALDPEIDRLAADYHASGRMVSRYQQVQSMSNISNEDAASLSGERNDHRRLQNRLREKFSQALAAGTGVFRGVPRDASDLGGTYSEGLRALLDRAVPDLYPKLDLGSPKLSGKEPEEVLRATNLQGLPPVFYDGDEGLGLVVSQDGKYVPNASAEVSKEVMDHLKGEHAYGNKVTGKLLEAHFGGMPYGWDKDVLRLVLAVLLRSGSMEVTHQGRRYRNHQDPQSRTPFAAIPAFRAASFAPRDVIDLGTLIAAVRQYENLTGGDVDVEEGAISTAFKKVATDEMSTLVPAISEARANDLPVVGTLYEYRDILQNVLDSASDDVVRILAGEGKSFGDSRETARLIREALSPDNLRLIRSSRAALSGMWPVLSGRPEGEGSKEPADELAALISSGEYYANLHRMETLSGKVSAAYRALYAATHGKRREAYEAALASLEKSGEWLDLASETRSQIAAPLARRSCGEADLPEGAATCRKCGATVGQMESDLAAAGGLTVRAHESILVAIAPEIPVEKVRVAAFFDGALESPETVDAAVERFREHLLKLVAEGARIVLE